MGCVSLRRADQSPARRLYARALRLPPPTHQLHVWLNSALYPFINKDIFLMSFINHVYLVYTLLASTFFHLMLRLAQEGSPASYLKSALYNKVTHNMYFLLKFHLLGFLQVESCIKASPSCFRQRCGLTLPGRSPAMTVLS
jgi:hypothetical protein